MPRTNLTTPTDTEKETREWHAHRGEYGFGSIIGQEDVVRRLRDFAVLFGERKPPGHVLFVGPDGMGKRTIARAFAADCCGGVLREREGDTLPNYGDVLGVLTNLAESDALLITDINRLTKSAVKCLLPAMTGGKVDFVVDRGMFAKTINIPLKPFVLLATAPSPGACSRELLECFHLTIPLVQRNSQTELALICQRIAQRKAIQMPPDVAALVAGASRGTPHDVELVVSKLASLGKAAIAQGDLTGIMSILGLRTRAANNGSPFTDMAGLSGVEFEHAITGLLERMGFCAQMTKATGDGGIDIAATLERPLIGGKYLFQCKRFASDNLVGAATVREFYGAVTADQEAVKGILVTTSGFTARAREFARHLRLELVDGEQLAKILTECGTENEPTGTVQHNPSPAAPFKPLSQEEKRKVVSEASRVLRIKA